MARLIIILESVDAAPEIGFRYAMWADVPVARQAHYADPDATSQVSDASAEELQALKDGTVVERVADARWPAGTTVPQIQGFLQTRHGDFQAQVNARNPWQRTGTSWDGTSWTVTNNG